MASFVCKHSLGLKVGALAGSVQPTIDKRADRTRLSGSDNHSSTLPSCTTRDKFSRSCKAHHKVVRTFSQTSPSHCRKYYLSSRFTSPPCRSLGERTTQDSGAFWGGLHALRKKRVPDTWHKLPSSHTPVLVSSSLTGPHGNPPVADKAGGDRHDATWHADVAERDVVGSPALHGIGRRQTLLAISAITAGSVSAVPGSQASAAELAVPGGARELDQVAASDGPAQLVAGDEEDLVVRVFEGATRSVVAILNLELPPGKAGLEEDAVVQGTGSGFVWDKFGHVVTNYHVIAKLATDPSGRQRSKVSILGPDGQVLTYGSTIVATDPSRDLAVVKIDAPPEILRPMAIGTSGDLRVGQACYAIGNPYGYAHTLTVGTVSGLGREIPSPVGRPIPNCIQTDAAINAGNSGGPLLDSFGRAIGVNTATFTRQGSGMSSGVNFAVPIDSVLRVVPQLIVNGSVAPTRPSFPPSFRPPQATPSPPPLAPAPASSGGGTR